MTASDVKTAVLHRRLTEHMDTETADALIERLPPDWEQLATKSDLAELSGRVAGLESTVEATKESVEAALAATKESVVAALVSMESRIDRRAARDLRTIVFTFAGFALAVVGMFVTVLVSGFPAAG